MGKFSAKIKGLDKNSKRDFFNYILVIVAFLLVQMAIGGDSISYSIRGQLVPVCAYIVMAISLNLTVGVLGELSLGHGAFMSIGAFSGVFFTMVTEQSIPSDGARLFLGFLVGTAMAALMGFLIGIPVLRLKGDYLAIVTLAFGEIVKNILNVLYVGMDKNGVRAAIGEESKLNLALDGKNIISGAMGVAGGTKMSTFFIGFILVLVALFVAQNLVRSRTGRAIMAIRDNRIAAQAMGINITKYKLIAFTISAGLAGAAGVLYGHNYSTFQGAKFDYTMSIQILLFVVLGGMGSFRGAIISATVLTLLPEMLRGLQSYRMLIYAIVLILVMIFNQSPKAIQWRAAMMEKLPDIPFVKKKINPKGGN